MSKRVTVGDMKAETNGKTSFIAIDDIGDLLRGQAARMGSLQICYVKLQRVSEDIGYFILYDQCPWFATDMRCLRSSIEAACAFYLKYHSGQGSSVNINYEF